MARKLPFFDYVTLGFIVLYTVAAITVSLLRYWQGQFYYFDFGIFDSAIYQAAHLQAPMIDHFELSSGKVSIFATHFYPSIFLLSPLFWITERPEILLIAQSISVGTALFFAYLMSKKLIKSSFPRFVLVFAFGGFIGLQNALISEIHDVTLAVLPLTICFWAIISRKWTYYLISFLILLGFKESFFGLGIGLALFIFMQERKNLTIALITLFLSILWGITSILYVIPYFSGGKYLYTQSDPPHSWDGILLAFFTPGIKISTMFYSLLTFGLLPLLFLPVYPLIIAQFMERFLFAFPSRWGLGFHYGATLAPILFVGSVYVIAFLEKQKMPRIAALYSAVIFIVVLFMHRFLFHGPLGLFYNPDFYSQPQPVNTFSLQFPKDKVIMTQNNLALHFTHQDVRLLRKTYDYIKPDIVLLDLSPGQTSNSFYPVTFEDAKQIKNQLLEDKNYSLINKIEPEVYVFENKAGN